MAASTNRLTLILAAEDAAGVSVLNRTIGAIEFAGSVGAFKQDTLLDTSAHTQTLPNGITTVKQWYLKNTHATGLITVTATPQGGASAVLAVLGPGEVMVPCWVPDAATSSTGVGYSAISLTASVASTTFEQFIGG